MYLKYLLFIFSIAGKDGMLINIVFSSLIIIYYLHSAVDFEYCLEYLL